MPRIWIRVPKPDPDSQEFLNRIHIHRNLKTRSGQKTDPTGSGSKTLLVSFKIRTDVTFEPDRSFCCCCCYIGKNLNLKFTRIQNIYDCMYMCDVEDPLDVDLIFMLAVSSYMYHHSCLIWASNHNSTFLHNPQFIVYILN